MEYRVVELLGPSEVRRMRAELAGMVFVDGKMSAGRGAREVKNNLQAQGEGAAEWLGQQVMAAMRRNAHLQRFVMPRKMVPPVFARYAAGMEYGDHVDAASMGDVRTDFAMTLFLSGPEEYVGGELVLCTREREERVKLGEGEAIVYSADTIHRVERVESGERVVAVSWMQSAVRDAAMRGVLCDLAELVEGEMDRLQLARAYQNLRRIASEG